MKSGHYIRSQKGDSIDQLAAMYNVSPESIRNANPDLKLKNGEWVLIPLARGFLIKILDGIGKRNPPSSSPTGIPSEKEDSEEAPVYVAKSKFLWPVPASQTISSYFGKRNGRNHDGIDIPAKRGKAILAVQSGKVIYSGNGLSGYGNLTILSHGKDMYTVYAHASKNLTRKDQKVKRGQTIALIGNTGRSSGPHLHFEVRKKNTKLDPMAFLPKPAKSKKKTNSYMAKN